MSYLRRSLLEEEEVVVQNGYEPDKSSLVMGVGVGVFLLVFFGIIACITCWTGIMIYDKPCSFCAWTTFLYGIIVIYLFCAERRSTTYDSVRTEDYNDGWYAKYIIGSVMFCCVYWCCISFIRVECSEHVSAIPRHHPKTPLWDPERFPKKQQSYNAWWNEKVNGVYLWYSGLLTWIGGFTNSNWREEFQQRRDEWRGISTSRRGAQ